MFSIKLCIQEQRIFTDPVSLLCVYSLTTFVLVKGLFGLHQVVQEQTREGHVAQGPMRSSRSQLVLVGLPLIPLIHTGVLQSLTAVTKSTSSHCLLESVTDPFIDEKLKLGYEGYLTHESMGLSDITSTLHICPPPQLLKQNMWNRFSLR